LCYIFPHNEKICPKCYHQIEKLNPIEWVICLEKKEELKHFKWLYSFLVCQICYYKIILK
jgi:hypothetical protein